MICGIDYGNKMAGTTSICYIKEGAVKFERSAKKQDADTMIHAFCQREQPDLIALDAPLSLPGVFTNLRGFDDYFYRKADKELKAISPMFLGGLTARAMKLKSKLLEVTFIETYPVYRGRELGFGQFGYRGDFPDYSLMLKELDMGSNAEIRSSHDFDAFLCFEIALRYLEGNSKCVGDPREGLIYY